MLLGRRVLLAASVPATLNGGVGIHHKKTTELDSSARSLLA